MVRSNLPLISGKWYWEVTIGALGSYSPCIGVATSSATLNNFLGSDAYGWSYYGWGSSLINNNVRPAYGTTFTTGDIIGVAFDTYSGILSFYKNGASLGVAYTGLSGVTVYAAVSGAASNYQQISVNFGASSLVYTPPSGFNAGLYTYSSGLCEFFRCSEPFAQHLTRCSLILDFAGFLVVNIHC